MVDGGNLHSRSAIRVVPIDKGVRPEPRRLRVRTAQRVWVGSIDGRLAAVVVLARRP